MASLSPSTSPTASRAAVHPEPAVHDSKTPAEWTTDVGATAPRLKMDSMRSDSMEAADPEFIAGDNSSLSSGDLSKQDFIFSYDSLWNDESMAAWESEKELNFRDMELATADASPVRRRRTDGKPQDTDPMQPAMGSATSSAGNATFLQAVAKHDPKSAEYVARMLSSNIEADSINGSGTTLHWGTLIEQMLLQTLFPFHLPIVWWMYEPAACRNLGMVLFSAKSMADARNFIVEFITSIMTLTPLVVFYTAPDLIPNMYQIEVWALMGVFVMQNFVISLKYATMPANAYEVVMTRDIPSRVRSSEQLITGWLRPSSIVLTREILETASRLGVDLDAVKFGFQPASREAVARLFHSVERLLPPRLHADFDPDTEIPMSYVLFSILAREIVRRKPYKVFFIAWVVAMVNTGVFPLLRGLVGIAPFGTTSVELWLHISTTVGTVLWFVPLMTFMLVAIKDYHMRCKSQQVLGSLISRKRNRADGRFFEPLLDIKASPGNVSAFVLARRMLLSVGERYSFRLQFLTSVVTLLTLGFGVGVLAITLTQPTRAAWGAFEVFTTVELSVVGVMLVVMLTSGAGANSRAEEHIALLSARQLEIRQHLVGYHAIAQSFRMRGAKMAMMQSMAKAGGAAGAAVSEMMNSMAKKGMASIASLMAAGNGGTSPFAGSADARVTLTSSGAGAGAAGTRGNGAPPTAVRMDSEGGPDQLDTITDDGADADPKGFFGSTPVMGFARRFGSGAGIGGDSGDPLPSTTQGKPGLAQRQSFKQGGKIGVAASTPRRSRRSSYEPGKLLSPTELLGFARAGADAADGILLGPNGGPMECELANVISSVEDLDRLLEPAKEAIRADAQLHPVRLLGLPATMNLLRSGIVILSTCVSLALRLLWV